MPLRFTNGNGIGNWKMIVWKCVSCAITRRGGERARWLPKGAPTALPSRSFGRGMGMGGGRLLPLRALSDKHGGRHVPPGSVYRVRASCHWGLSPGCQTSLPQNRAPVFYKYQSQANQSVVPWVCLAPFFKDRHYICPLPIIWALTLFPYAQR